MKFNAPPNWPQPPADWTPPPGWSPDPAWGPAPEGWQLWVEDEDTTTGSPSAPPAWAAPPGPPGPERAKRLTSSWKEQSRRAATASSGLWSRATASPRRHWTFDGRRTGTWDVFEASWGYHPDDGVNLVIEEVE